jgi:hypothetical protein
VCTGFALVETHVSARPVEKQTYRGIEYCGRSFTEHAADTTLAQRAKRPRSSLDNPTSFWLTKPSLTDALYLSGFTSVLEVPIPPADNHFRDRCRFVAVRGTEQYAGSDHEGRRWPERDRRRPHQSQDRWLQLKSRARRAVTGVQARMSRRGRT